jgi:GTP-binding protein
MIRHSFPSRVVTSCWRPLQPICYFSSEVKIKTDVESSSVSDSVEGADMSKEEQQSFRKRLRTVNPDTKILNYLDQHKLGYLTTRRARVKVARKFDKIEKMSNLRDFQAAIAIPEKGKSSSEIRKTYPFPFKHTGKVLFSMKNDVNLELLGGIPGNPSQIGIIGRSNVGKSTLVNALVGFDSSFVQKAIVSNRPGETRSLTFYQIGKIPFPKDLPINLAMKEEEIEELKKFQNVPALILVDMPGYGFAYMNEKDKERCRRLYIEYLFDSQYLSTSPVKRLVLLLDARHGFKKADIEFLQLLTETYKEYQSKYGTKAVKKEKAKVEKDIAKNSSSVTEQENHMDINEVEQGIIKVDIKESFPKHLSWKLQIILTKCDLVERIELCKIIQLVKKDLHEHISSYLYHDIPVLAVSGYEKTGLIPLQKELINTISFPLAKTYMKKLKEKEEKSEEIQKARYARKKLLEKQGIKQKKFSPPVGKGKSGTEPTKDRRKKAVGSKVRDRKSGKFIRVDNRERKSSPKRYPRDDDGYDGGDEDFEPSRKKSQFTRQFKDDKKPFKKSSDRTFDKNSFTRDDYGSDNSFNAGKQKPGPRREGRSMKEARTEKRFKIRNDLNGDDENKMSKADGSVDRRQDKKKFFEGEDRRDFREKNSDKQVSHKDFDGKFARRNTTTGKDFRKNEKSYKRSDVETEKAKKSEKGSVRSQVKRNQGSDYDEVYFDVDKVKDPVFEESKSSGTSRRGRRSFPSQK